MHGCQLIPEVVVPGWYMDARSLDYMQFPAIMEAMRDTASASTPATTPPVTFPRKIFVSAAIVHDPRCYHVRRGCRNAPTKYDIKEATLCKACLADVGVGEVEMLTRQV
jgi:hypothetical protein